MMKNGSLFAFPLADLHPSRELHILCKKILGKNF